MYIVFLSQCSQYNLAYVKVEGKNAITLIFIQVFHSCVLFNDKFVARVKKEKEKKELNK